MNKELKEQAHKEFDKNFGIPPYQNENLNWNEASPEIKSFFDSLIDKTVQQTEEGVRRRFIEKFCIDGIEISPDTQIKVFEPPKTFRRRISLKEDHAHEILKDILFIVTNNSEINK